MSTAEQIQNEDAIEWGNLPPTKKARVRAMIPQLVARSPEWGRLPVDISKAVVLAAANEAKIPIDVATRKRDGVTRVWARIRVDEAATP